MVDDSPIEFFESRGFEVRVEGQDVHADLVARGQTGAASFYVQGRTYFVVDLLRDGVVVAPRYGIAETEDEALRGARRRYGSEQD